MKHLEHAKRLLTILSILFGGLVAQYVFYGLITFTSINTDNYTNINWVFQDLYISILLLIGYITGYKAK
jgi:hypothetical protein